MSGNPNLQPVKKRKKHAPDRQQPEWLFPAPTENPALKPHKEATAEEKLSKQKSIDFLTRSSVGAPQKPAPPPQLLNLVATFLAEYSFISTGRLFASERQGRSMVDGWQDDTKGHLEQGMPTLSKIYKEWRKEWDERRMLDMTSDEDDDAATKREKMLKKRGTSAAARAGETKDASSSTETSSEESDAEMGGVSSIKPLSLKTPSKTAASSSSTSSSDSEGENKPSTINAIPSNAGSPSSKTGVKRKAASRGSSSSSAASSSVEDAAPKAKKKKVSAKPAVSRAKSVSSSSTSSTSNSDSDSNSESDSDPTPDPKSAAKAMSLAVKTPLPQSSSDSASTSDSSSDDTSLVENTTAVNAVGVSDTSATLSDGPKKATSSASTSDSSSVSDDSSKVKAVKADLRTILGQKLSTSLPTSQMPIAARKLNQPFSRIPKDIKVDPRLASNAYVSYDYAEQAHQDLIVTKGKGFTKEKNKKKRGSYRGGYIDVDGKKGIKFDD